MNSSSGILMHISSLPSDYSCGNFGKSAYKFVDFLKNSGFKYWQVLPFCIPDEYNSPYMSQASFFGNPNFIDLDALYDKGLLTREELEGAKQENPYLCEFERLNSERMALLTKCAQRCDYKSKVLEFICSHSEIKKACEFMALKEVNDFAPWQEWSTTDIDENRVLPYYFMQYEFYSQWQKLHSYANENGVFIIGDVPFYVSLDSSDVYYNQEQFLLDSDGYPTVVAGVPPDYFSEEGQLWGNPVYDFDAVKKSGFTWWKDRISYMLDLFDGIRLDHFRAFAQYYCVPFGSENAINGKWCDGPDKEIIDVFKEIAGDKLIIAENLGSIDDKVEALLEYSGFMSMSVLQFGFDGNNQNPHLPHTYTKGTVAYTGTHDNNTLLGWVWELDEGTRKNMLDYIGFVGDDWNQSYDCIIKALLRSRAGITIFPIQDILKYGADTRVNTPGKADKNWRFRITEAQLLEIDIDKFKRFNYMFGRI